MHSRAHTRTHALACQALFAALEREGVEARVNGPAEAALRLPNTLSVSVRGVVGAHLVEACSEKVRAGAFVRFRAVRMEARACECVCVFVRV